MNIKIRLLKDLDYNISSTSERIQKVEEILQEYDQEIIEHFENHFNASPNMNQGVSDEDYMCQQLEKLGDYILHNSSRKEDGVLNKNRVKQVKKYESFSLNTLCEKEEAEETKINGYVIGTDQVNNNRKFKKSKIEQEDVENIPEIKHILEIEEILKEKTRDYKCNKLLRELREYKHRLLKLIKNPIEFKHIGFYSTKYDYSFLFPQVFADIIDFDKFEINNEKQIYELLEHYSELKELIYEQPDHDLTFALFVLEKTIEIANLPDSYLDILIWKIDRLSAKEICAKLQKKYGLVISEEKLSSIYKNKIPSLLFKVFKDWYEEWLYTFKIKGKWKKCSKCGEVKLATEKYFDKDETKNDKLKYICKECRKRDKNL